MLLTYKAKIIDAFTFVQHTIVPPVQLNFSFRLMSVKGAAQIVMGIPLINIPGGKISVTIIWSYKLTYVMVIRDGS